MGLGGEPIDDFGKLDPAKVRRQRGRNGSAGYFLAAAKVHIRFARLFSWQQFKKTAMSCLRNVSGRSRLPW